MAIDFYQSVDRNLLVIRRAGHLFHHRVTQRAAHLAHSPFGNGDAHLRRVPHQVAGPDVAGSLLAVKKTGENVDHSREQHSAAEAHRRAHSHPVAEVNADGAETSKRGHEDAQDAAAQKAGTCAVAVGVVA